MGLEDNEAQVKVLLVQNKIVRNEVDQQVEHHVSTTTGSVPECLEWHEAAKRGIEKIYQCCDPVSHNA